MGLRASAWKQDAGRGGGGGVLGDADGGRVVGMEEPCYGCDKQILWCYLSEGKSFIARELIG